MTCFKMTYFALGGRYCLFADIERLSKKRFIKKDGRVYAVFFYNMARSIIREEGGFSMQHADAADIRWKQRYQNFAKAVAQLTEASGKTIFTLTVFWSTQNSYDKL